MSSPSDQPDPTGQPEPFGQPDPGVRPPDPVMPQGPAGPPQQPPAAPGPQPPGAPPWPPVLPGGAPPAYPGPSAAPAPFPGSPPPGFGQPGAYPPPAAGPNPYLHNGPLQPAYGPRTSAITTGGVFIGVGIALVVIIIAFVIHDVPGGTGPIRLLVTGILPIVGCLLTIGRATRSIGLGMVIIGGAFWVTLIGPCFALLLP